MWVQVTENLEIGRDPKGKDSLPTIRFQGANSYTIKHKYSELNLI